MTPFNIHLNRTPVFTSKRFPFLNIIINPIQHDFSSWTRNNVVRGFDCRLVLLLHKTLGNHIVLKCNSCWRYNTITTVEANFTKQTYP